MLAGIAKCGVCGRSIGVVSRRYKNGVGYTTLGCGVHASRGRMISAKKLTNIVVETLRDPTLKARIAEAVQRRAAAAKKGADLAALEKQVATAETRAERDGRADGRRGTRKGLVEAVKTEEQRLAVLLSPRWLQPSPREGAR